MQRKSETKMDKCNIRTNDVFEQGLAQLSRTKLAALRRTLEHLCAQKGTRGISSLYHGNTG